jgi:hypothetical protein
MCLQHYTNARELRIGNIATFADRIRRPDAAPRHFRPRPASLDGAQFGVAVAPHLIPQFVESLLAFRVFRQLLLLHDLFAPDDGGCQTRPQNVGLA